jgi:valyl-tRNA synthetase
LRNDHNVKPSQTVSVSILAPGDSARSITGNRELLETLATCTLKEARGDLAPPKSAARVLAAGCEIYVEGLVDESAEKARVAKRCEELKKQIQAMKGRLANESYTAKAPPHLVQQTRDQLAAAEEEYAKLQA